MKNISIHPQVLYDLLKGQCEYLGVIKNPIYKRILGDKLKNDTIVATAEQIAHIMDGHGTIYFDYRHRISEFINDPDFVLEDKEYSDTIKIIKRIKNNVQIVLKLSLCGHKPNQIWTMWDTSQDVDLMKVANYVLYCKN